MPGEDDLHDPIPRRMATAACTIPARRRKVLFSEDGTGCGPLPKEEAARRIKFVLLDLLTRSRSRNNAMASRLDQYPAFEVRINMWSIGSKQVLGYAAE
jgi:hypothetical protein